MTLRHISILNFKNIPEAELDFSPGINCFIGENGEGKTNLLDAIYFLSLCKSHNISQDSLCIRHEQEAMMIRGEYVTEENEQETIHIGLKRGQKKVVRRGGKPYRRLAEHIGMIPLIMVSPEDNMLISGGSEERRRFMDVVISQTNPQYLDALVSYNKALQQRGILLKMEEEPDPTLLSIWEEEMARHGEFIYKTRTEFTADLLPIFSKFFSSISNNHEEVSLSYTSHCQRGPLLEVIQRDRHKDRAVGYSLHGTHRDDLEMMIDGYPLRKEGSQGQNRTVVLALKLAEYEFLKEASSRKHGRDIFPILLLDDIFDRLDSGRVERIIQLVSGKHFGQTFITDTNRDHTDQILSMTQREHSLFTLKGGKISSHIQFL